jgi:dolichol-phosphate mannosyltransferase
LKQQFRYLEHLSRLYDFTYPRLSPIAKFLIATAIGWLAALAAFMGLVAAGLGRVLAPTLAYPANILATFLLHLRYVRTQREFLIRPRPWRDFAVISLCEWAACAAAALWVHHRVAAPAWYETFGLPLIVATVARYILRKEFMQDIRGLRKDLRQRESEGESEEVKS